MPAAPAAPAIFALHNAEADATELSCRLPDGFLSITNEVLVDFPLEIMPVIRIKASLVIDDTTSTVEGYLALEEARRLHEILQSEIEMLAKSEADTRASLESD